MMYVIIGFFYIIASLFLSMHDEKLIGLDFPIKPSPKVIAINLMICVVFVNITPFQSHPIRAWEPHDTRFESQ